MHAMICIYSVQPYISKYISINITVGTFKQRTVMSHVPDGS